MILLKIEKWSKKLLKRDISWIINTKSKNRHFYKNKLIKRDENFNKTTSNNNCNKNLGINNLFICKSIDRANLIIIFQLFLNYFIILSNNYIIIGKLV